MKLKSYNGFINESHNFAGKSVEWYFPWYDYTKNPPEYDKTIASIFEFTKLNNAWRLSDYGGQGDCYSISIPRKSGKFGYETIYYLFRNGECKFMGETYIVDDWLDVERLRLQLTFSDRSKLENYKKILDELKKSNIIDTLESILLYYNDTSNKESNLEFEIDKSIELIMYANTHRHVFEVDGSDDDYINYMKSDTYANYVKNLDWKTIKFMDSIHNYASQYNTLSSAQLRSIRKIIKVPSSNYNDRYGILIRNKRMYADDNINDICSRLTTLKIEFIRSIDEQCIIIML